MCTHAQTPALRIPLINFSEFLQASSDAQKQRTADEIVTGFKEVGFIYLDKHGIPEETVQNAFDKVCHVVRPHP